MSTRGKTKRRRIAKAFRKAHRKEWRSEAEAVSLELMRMGFQATAQYDAAQKQRSADPHYGRVEKPLTEKALLDALEAAEKRNAGTPRFVAYGDSFADAFGLPRTGGAVVEVPREP